MDSFEFDSWVQEFELEEDTVKLLKEKGYKSYRSVSKLTEESINKHFKGLPPGQLDLLQEGIGLLKPKDSPQTAATTSTIESLLANMPTTSPEGTTAPPPAQLHQSTLSGERHELSVNAFLLPPTKIKYYDIVDFVAPVQREEHNVWEGEGCQLTISASTRKPSLESVSPMQWSAANLHIMFQLGNDGSLTQADTHRYLLYTLKVSELAAVYTWRSVLLYDRAYRRAQAQEGFSWGADSPHLDRIHLRHRDHPPNALKTSHAPSTKSTARTPGSSGEICRNYLRDACGFGAACIHRHVCSLPACGAEHPFIRHPGKNQLNM